MSFTTAERVNIRRFCGYPQYGGTPSSFQSYRFFQAYGTLEYRMSNMLAEEETVVRSTYLASLVQLETDIIGTAGVRTNLDTDEAAVWKHNKNELTDRKALFNGTRRDLCGFMGIPPGPSLGGNDGRLIV